MSTSEFLEPYLEKIVDVVDKYATPFNITVIVSTAILMSVVIFLIDYVVPASSTSISTRGKYLKYADENNDDPKDKSYDPQNDDESSSEEEEAEPVGVRRSSRLRKKRIAAKKAAKKAGKKKSRK